MSTIIDKILDCLVRQKRKIPQAMITIFIFTLFFPDEAINVKDILLTKIQIILPVSLKTRLFQLRFSLNELLTIWAFLLVIYMFIVISNVLTQLLKGQTTIFIDSSGEALFEINSIIFLSLLIYIRYYGIKIKNSIPQFSDFYGFILTISLLLFIFVFYLTYGTIFSLIYHKIKITLSSKMRKL